MAALLAAVLYCLLAPRPLWFRRCLPGRLRSLASLTWEAEAGFYRDPKLGRRSWLIHPSQKQGRPSEHSMSSRAGIRRVIKRANDCRRFKARISYRGELFCGWQKQGTGTRTIEGTLEASLSPAVGQALRFFPAGRTDSGVSAVGKCKSVTHSRAPRRHSLDLTPFSAGFVRVSDVCAIGQCITFDAMLAESSPGA